MSKLFQKSLLIIVLVLIADQVLKFWIKTHMYLGQEYDIAGNWFLIHFVENPGMAFGLEFGGGYGKIALSLFRIGAVIAIGYYLSSIIKQKANTVLVVALSLIFAGAIGNIIDSVFYGMLFSSSEFQVAQFLPTDGGYGTFLHGRVVDMFYFPLVRGYFPQWVPVFGGDDFEFFRPVFNLADSAITVGVSFFIIFQKSIFKKHDENENASESNLIAKTDDEVLKNNNVSEDGVNLQ